LRTLIRKNDDLIASPKGKENKSTALSLNLSLTEDGIPGESILMPGVGAPSFLPIAVILKTLDRGSLNSRFNKLVLDILRESPDESVEDDGDDNKSEIVKCGVLPDGIPGYDGIRRSEKFDWSEFDCDPDVEGRSYDNNDEDPEVEGSG